MSKLKKALAAAALIASSAAADITTGIEYRCYDYTARESYGGWVSYRDTAVRLCNDLRKKRPNNSLGIQSRQN